MTKKAKLKICNLSLLGVTAGMLATGIWLEATGSGGAVAVWLHMALGIAMMALAGWHVWLHFGASNWFRKFGKLKSQFTRVLWWAALATLVSGLAAAIHWLAFAGHSPIGGVHGKIGFIMIALCICHIAKRAKFFKKL